MFWRGVRIPPRKCLKCGKRLENGEPRIFGDFVLISLCQKHAEEQAEKEIDRAIELGPVEGMKYLFGEGVSLEDVSDVSTDAETHTGVKLEEE